MSSLLEEVFSFETTVVLRAVDDEGRFLLCFPCGHVYRTPERMLAHLGGSEEHLLNNTIPLGLVETVTEQRVWLSATVIGKAAS